MRAARHAGAAQRCRCGRRHGASHAEHRWCGACVLQMVFAMAPMSARVAHVCLMAKPTRECHAHEHFQCCPHGPPGANTVCCPRASGPGCNSVRHAMPPHTPARRNRAAFGMPCTHTHVPGCHMERRARRSRQTTGNGNATHNAYTEQHHNHRQRTVQHHGQRNTLALVDEHTDILGVMQNSHRPSLVTVMLHAPAHLSPFDLAVACVPVGLGLDRTSIRGHQHPPRYETRKALYLCACFSVHRPCRDDEPVNVCFQLRAKPLPCQSLMFRLPWDPFRLQSVSLEIPALLPPPLKHARTHHDLCQAFLSAYWPIDPSLILLWSGPCPNGPGHLAGLQVLLR